MSAGTGDKFSDTYNAANPNVARVTSTRSAAATSLSCDNLAGWPTSSSTKVHFSTYKINTSGAVVAGSQIDWTGIVTGNTIGSMVRVTGATDNGNAVNDVVEMNPTAKWASELVNGILVEHTQAGVHTLTSSSTLTSSKFITALNDTNGNELFKVTPTASAVNEFTVANAATGAGPTLSATGGDTNIDVNINTKGTGVYKLNGLQVGTISSSSNLGSRTQSLTASGSSTIAYSSSNPTMTLTPGKYLLVVTATAKAAISAQDSSFNAVLYNDTSSAEVVANGTTSTGSSTTVYPTFSVHSIVTPSVSTTYSGRVSQTFGSGAVYTYVNSTLIAIPLTA